MGLNTYPYNPFPASTDKLDEAHNEQIQEEVDQLKSGLTDLSEEVNGDAVEYPYADVITIEDAVPSNLAECNVKIEPDQNLHGYDKPWVGGAGKNKLPLVLAEIKSLNTYGTWSENVYTENSVKYTVLLDNDGNVIGVNIDGVGSTATGIILAANQTFDTDCLLSKGNSSGVGVVSLALLNNAGTEVAVEATSTGATVEAGNYGNVRIRVNANITVSNVYIYPMIRLATETDATFAPYTNICPITGHTDASVEVTDGDETTQTYTIALGDTIYGGTMDFDSGVMTVDRKYDYIDGSDTTRLTTASGQLQIAISSDSKTTTDSYHKVGDLLCNRFDEIFSNSRATNGIYYRANGSHNLLVRGNDYTAETTLADWVTWLGNNPLQIVYGLATPTTIQLTPKQIQLLKGQNTLTASTGHISVTVNGVNGSIGAVQEQVNELADREIHSKEVSLDGVELNIHVGDVWYQKVTVTLPTGACIIGVSYGTQFEPDVIPYVQSTNAVILTCASTKTISNKVMTVYYANIA